MGIVGSGKSLIYLFTVSYGNGMSLRGEKENKIKQLGEWKPRRLNTNLMHLDAGCCLAPYEEGCTFVFRRMGPCARARVFIHAGCACESTRMCGKCPGHHPCEKRDEEEQIKFFFSQCACELHFTKR